MKTSKINHNDPCPCGSGKKYKYCCLLKERNNKCFHDSTLIDEEINNAGMLSLEHDSKAIEDAISKLQTLSEYQDLTLDQRLNIKLHLAQAHQRRGEHMTAIEVLDSIQVKDDFKQYDTLTAYTKLLRATSYNALGLSDKACEIFTEVLKEVGNSISTDARLRAIVCIEAGKACRATGDNNQAKILWEEALKYFEDKKGEDLEHYTRVKANLGFMLLDSSDESKQEEGVKIIEAASLDKGRIGDLEGLSNNYCNLGLYYWKKRRFERAIAYTRKDLFISRKVGDFRSIATTLCNLAAIYGDLRQLTSARKLLKEAKQIANNLEDERLNVIVNNGLKRINEIGRHAGKNNEIVGHLASCACGSGKQYQDCCGTADFEPVDIPILFDGMSSDLEPIQEELTSVGKEPSRLDFIFRETEQSRNRLSWTHLEVHDGWVSMSELPDMANHYLTSARVLAKEAETESDSTTKPLACVILSVCALESFINQVAFFLSEIKDFHESKLHTIPTELGSDALAFQRSTELTVKWEILGRALCGKYWPPKQSLIHDLKNMIYIRNELIHFKASDYEQIIPSPRIPSNVMRKIPNSVEIRDILRAWPFRVLTPSFASWCVGVAESMIEYFKQSYKQSRLL